MVEATSSSRTTRMVDVNACSSYLSFLQNAAANNKGADNSRSTASGEQNYNFSALRRNSNNQRRLSSAALHQYHQGLSSLSAHREDDYHYEDDRDDENNTFNSWLEWGTSSCTVNNPCMTFSATRNYDNAYNVGVTSNGEDHSLK